MTARAPMSFTEDDLDKIDRWRAQGTPVGWRVIGARLNRNKDRCRRAYDERHKIARPVQPPRVSQKGVPGNKLPTPPASAQLADAESPSSARRRAMGEAWDRAMAMERAT